MLKLLLISEDTSSFIVKSYAYLEEELSKITKLMIWRQGGDIREILKQIPEKPDFILINDDIGDTFTLHVNGLSEIDIPVGLFVNDVHRNVQLRENYVSQNNIKHLFSVVKYRFFKTYPQYQDRFNWFPHFINPQIFHHHGEKREIDLLLMGAVNIFYPMRQMILKHYENDARFMFRKHPGYDSFPNESQVLIGKNFAKELSKAKIFFTCGSILNYPVLKYYETLAAKTLLLAPTFPELEELGFIPNKHFVPITFHDFPEKADYYLANEKERNEIIEQGYQFVMENHTVQIRARQLVKRIEEIINR